MVWSSQALKHFFPKRQNNLRQHCHNLVQSQTIPLKHPEKTWKDICNPSWIFACMSMHQRGYIYVYITRKGQQHFQEQSINLNQVRQNATRHLPEEKCSQVLGLIESTLWFSGHRLACGLIITSTQALLSKTSKQSATALPQPGSITDHISLKHPEKTWKDICNPSMNLCLHVHAPARLYLRIYN